MKCNLKCAQDRKKQSNKCNLRCVQDINNGNWTEWGAIWAEIIHVISIWNHNYHFRPKLHDTSFNYHFITSILKSPKYRTWSVQTFYWCSTEPVWKFIHLLGGKSKSFGNKSCKICHMILFVFIFLQFDWLFYFIFSLENLMGCFVFGVACSLAGKKGGFKAKNGAIRE